MTYDDHTIDDTQINALEGHLNALVSASVDLGHARSAQRSGTETFQEVAFCEKDVEDVKVRLLIALGLKDEACRVKAAAQRTLDRALEALEVSA